MQIRKPCVASLMVMGLVGFRGRAEGAPAPASVEDRRLLVLEAPGNVLTETARTRLHAAIAEVAAQRGLAVVSPASLPVKLLTCDLPGCLSPIAAASGAVFVLQVDAKFAQESFKLGLELWNSDEGKLLGKERRDCPICDEQDLWGSAAFMARGLLERAIRAAATTPGSPAGLGSRPAAVAPTTPSLTQRPSRTSATATVRTVGLALSGAGLIGLLTGIYYWRADGDRADGDYVRDTKKLGQPLTLFGGAALVAGAGLVAWTVASGAAEGAATPDGLRVAGRF